MGHCKNFAIVKFFLKWAGAEKENFDDHWSKKERTILMTGGFRVKED